MTAMLSRLFLLAGLLASPAALGQTYPDRNVTIVVTSAAGALTDVLTRAVAQRLSEMWKQSVVVENRGGAGYSIAAQSVMRAEHDGYTLLASETGFYTTQNAFIRVYISGSFLGTSRGKISDVQR